MNQFRFWISGEPTAQARPRVTRKGCYYPEKSSSYRTWAVLQLKAQNAGRPPLAGPFRLQITVWIKRPKSNKSLRPIVKPDWDNFGKQISDALGKRKGAGILGDDAQVCDGRVIKRWATEWIEPGVEVVVEAL